MKAGKIAEKIVKELFEEAGYEVIRYGYEYTVPRLARRKIKIIGEAADYIRHQPDFVVINKKNEAFFVEVKFRSSGVIKKEHMFYYPSCYVVFLTPTLILGQSLEKVYKYGDKFEMLNTLEPFKYIPSKLISKYVNKTRRMLGDETLFGQWLTHILEKITKRRLKVSKRIPVGIEGRTHTIKGWERVDSVPEWVLKNIKNRKVKRILKGYEINGRHYKYRKVMGRDGKWRYFKKKR